MSVVVQVSDLSAARSSATFVWIGGSPVCRSRSASRAMILCASPPHAQLCVGSQKRAAGTKKRIVEQSRKRIIASVDRMRVSGSGPYASIIVGRARYRPGYERNGMNGHRILASPTLWVGLLFAVLLLRMEALRPVFQWAFPGVEPVIYQRSSFPALFLSHLALVAAASLAATSIGLSLAVFVTRPVGRDFRLIVTSLATVADLSFAGLERWLRRETSLISR